MPYHSVQLTSYKIELGHRLNFESKGAVYCNGTDGIQVKVYFMANGSSMPAPQISVDGKIFTMFFPIEQMALWTDMLRNEKPLYAHIDNRIPTGTSVSTNQEPVGDNDKASLLPFPFTFP